MSWVWLLALGQAQDVAEFDETLKEHEEFEEAAADLSAELGGSMTTGNIAFYTVSVAVHGGYKWKENRLSGTSSALWGQGRVDADDNGTLDQTERNAAPVETARRAAGDLRYDRFFGERNSLYASGGGLIDPFAGYDLRTHEQLGYSRHLLAKDDTSIVVEGGIDYAQENYVAGVDPNSANVIAGRAMASARHAVSEYFSFENKSEFLENLQDFKDLRVNNDVIISARINGSLSMKLSHSLRFDNQPVEGFRPTDQTALATLVATLR
jgi:putative salt-induced outer membrane protein YdiY